MISQHTSTFISSGRQLWRSRAECFEFLWTCPVLKRWYSHPFLVKTKLTKTCSTYFYRLDQKVGNLVVFDLFVSFCYWQKRLLAWLMIILSEMLFKTTITVQSSQRHAFWMCNANQDTGTVTCRQTTSYLIQLSLIPSHTHLLVCLLWQSAHWASSVSEDPFSCACPSVICDVVAEVAGGGTAGTLVGTFNRCPRLRTFRLTFVWPQRGSVCKNLDTR